MSWLWFSCLALLFLLPPVSFAQTHLWQFRPFRANDTDHSGGDHICDLRRDSNADGKPDRLGSRVTVSGTVISEPSTFETEGRLFWIREGGCGILVYGEPESLRLGDSVVVTGWVRMPGCNCIWPEMGLATMGDVAIESKDVNLKVSDGDHEPTYVSSEGFVDSAAVWAGTLVRLNSPVEVTGVVSTREGDFAWARCGHDSFIVYVDVDTDCSVADGRCYLLTGVVASIRLTCGTGGSSAWCLVPRDPGDMIEAGCSSRLMSIRWGCLKSRY
jgi:hypothetical protein